MGYFTQMLNSENGVPFCIALLEGLPVRVGEITPLDPSRGSYLVNFKYWSDKKDAWVSQKAPYILQDSDVLDDSEYCNMLSYIVGLSADIESRLSEEDD